jgi:hypothetical protein
MQACLKSLSFFAFCAFGVARAASYTLEPTQYGMQLKTPDGRIVLEYMTKKPENIGLTSPSVACFHPVRTPSGEVITSLAPDDHPHHRGIYFGFHDSLFYEPSNRPNPSPTASLKAATVRRADFWGWGVYAPREGRVVQNREVRLTRGDADRAELEIVNDLLIEGRNMGQDGYKAVVTERDGVFVIDLDYQLTPRFEYVANKNAFGGFVLQARKDGDSYYSTPAGKVTRRDPHYAYPELDWPSEPWYDYTIALKNTGKVIGAAVIDHPSNPPTLWHNSRTLWMLNPVITALGPVTILPDAPLKLRYRIVVHDGPVPTNVLNKLSAEWRSN